MADTKISALPASSTPLAGTEVLPIVQSGATKQVSVADLTAGRTVSALGYEAVAATGVSPASPVLMQVRSTTNTSGWSTTLPWGRYAYYSDDASGAGPQIHIALDAVMRASTGAYSKLSIKLADGAGALVERVAVDPVAGDTTLSTGNLVIGTSGKGIDFSADSHAAGMTSELLDDYEEGTWTPTTAGDATGAFSAQGGKYTKVGNVVTVYGAFNVSTNFTSALVGGLPYTPSPNLAVSSIFSSIEAATSTSVVNATLNNSTNITFSAAPNTVNDVYRFCFSYIV